MLGSSCIISTAFWLSDLYSASLIHLSREQRRVRRYDKEGGRLSYGIHCVLVTHLKRAPSNFFLIRFWSVVRFGSTESATFGGYCNLDPPFSLGFVCVPFGCFEGFFVSLSSAFTGGAFGGGTAVDLSSATLASRPVDFLPLCFFFGGWSKVSMSLSRLT